jgi:hypothetical protein
LFELALLLHTPVYLLAEMPYTEYLQWSSYLSKRPIGWREDHRASLLMRASGAKIKPEDVFPSIKAMNDAEREDKTIANSITKSFLFTQMINAKGGDKLEL